MCTCQRQTSNIQKTFIIFVNTINTYQLTIPIDAVVWQPSPARVSPQYAGTHPSCTTSGNRYTATICVYMDVW